MADNFQGKLTESEQYQVCQWYGAFKTPTQIRALIKAQFGKELHPKSIWEYLHTRSRWKPLIERLRQEWALGVMDIPLAHKRARLEKLVSLLKKAEGNDEVPEYRRIYQAVNILREIREEMGVGKGEFTNVFMTTINNYSDEEIYQQREAVLTRLRQLGRTNGLRNGSQAATGAGEREAEVITGGSGSGGGLHRGLVGEGDGKTPEDPGDSSGAGIPLSPPGEITDARGDGTSAEGQGPEAGSL